MKTHTHNIGMRKKIKTLSSSPRFHFTKAMLFHGARTFRMADAAKFILAKMK
jgi:hypothetical protein